jgi:hypothetical protein
MRQINSARAAGARHAIAPGLPASEGMDMIVSVAVMAAADVLFVINRGFVCAGAKNTTLSCGNNHDASSLLLNGIVSEQAPKRCLFDHKDQVFHPIG